MKDDEPTTQTLQDWQSTPLSGEPVEPERASSPRKSQAPAKAAARTSTSTKAAAAKAGATKKREETQ